MDARGTGSPVGFLVKIYPKISETFILEEILALERNGVALHLFSAARPTDAITHHEVAAVRAPVTYLPEAGWREAGAFAWALLVALVLHPLRFVATLGFALTRKEAGALRDFVRGAWLAQAMRQSGVRHLHAHFISQPADLAEMMQRLSGLGMSISAHAKDIYLSHPDSLARKLARARFTVTCTEYNRRHLAGIAPGARVHRMYHGVDFKRFDPRLRVPTGGEAPLILSVGRLRAKKGFPTLIEACRLLRERGIAFRCEIVGYGEEEARLRALIHAAGLTDAITLPGKLARDEVVARYARATAFALPSQLGDDGDRDGIPNVLLEAMAMELPVVSTHVSGIPELVEHGKNGMLVSPAAPVELADALAELLACAELRQRLGAAARVAVAQAFDNDRNVHLLRGLLGLDVQPAGAMPAPATLAGDGYAGKA